MTIAIATESPPILVDKDGVVRVGKTRVTLDTLVTAFEEGYTAEEIVNQYPSLHLADVYATISYYLHHRAEVNEYLNQRKQQAAEVRQQNEQRFSTSELRQRLLARRADFA